MRYDSLRDVDGKNKVYVLNERVDANDLDFHHRYVLQCKRGDCQNQWAEASVILYV